MRDERSPCGGHFDAGDDELGPCSGFEVDGDGERAAMAEMRRCRSLFISGRGDGGVCFAPF